MTPTQLRTDQPLHSRLTAIARTENLSLNAYLVRLVRANVNRRQRLAATVRLDWRATDAELADALSAAVATPLSDIEQHGLKGLTPEQAVGYAAARAAKKRTSKPAPLAGTKPAPASSTKPAPSPGAPPPKQRANAVPAPAKAQTRCAAIVLSSAEYGRLLALRAKRAGKPAPDRQPSANTFTVQGDDADARAIVAARGGR